MGIGTTVFQSVNILLALAMLGCVITAFVLLLKVLFKLNKALDIWLKQNGENK